MRGNQYVVKGVKGQRINRNTGQKGKRTVGSVDIRGSSYPALVIRKTIARSAVLESIKDMNIMRGFASPLFQKQIR